MPSTWRYVVEYTLALQSTHIRSVENIVQEPIHRCRESDRSHYSKLYLPTDSPYVYFGCCLPATHSHFTNLTKLSYSNILAYLHTRKPKTNPTTTRSALPAVATPHMRRHWLYTPRTLLKHSKVNWRTSQTIVHLPFGWQASQTYVKIQIVFGFWNSSILDRSKFLWIGFM